MIYLIGSLRNPEVPKITKKLRDLGFDVFAEWYGAGERADDHFKEYHSGLGRTYLEALKTPAAKTIFEFDKHHIDKSDTVILATPAGKSGHMEFGYAIGSGKKGYYLLDDPDRWDLMLQFATKIFINLEDLVKELENDRKMGSFSFGPSTIRLDSKQRSLNPDGSCNSSGEQLSHVSGLQRISQWNGGQTGVVEQPRGETEQGDPLRNERTTLR